MAESVEIKGRALKWYIENPLATLRDVGEEFDIPYETVRDWGKNESWVSKRVLRGTTPSDQVLKQAEGIRIALYEEILSGSNRDLPNLVKAWKSTMDIQAAPEEEETVDRDTLLG
jgi:hypothetical protein